MGYAVLRQAAGELTLLACGTLETPSDLELSRRLKLLYDGLIQIIDDLRPTELAVEELFFNRNVRSALSVGQARGVALLAAAHRDLAVYGYTPLQVKGAIAGYGRARKEQIQDMIRILLRLPEILRPDDAADAAAIAVCHLHSIATREMIERSLAPPTSRTGTRR
jgi:crossover junction endodeoxyribonuclease RuvC